MYSKKRHCTFFSKPPEERPPEPFYECTVTVHCHFKKTTLSYIVCLCGSPSIVVIFSAVQSQIADSAAPDHPLFLRPGAITPADLLLATTPPSADLTAPLGSPMITSGTWSDHTSGPGADRRCRSAARHFPIRRSHQPTRISQSHLRPRLIRSCLHRSGSPINPPAAWCCCRGSMLHNYPDIP